MLPVPFWLFSVHFKAKKKEKSLQSLLPNLLSGLFLELWVDFRWTSLGIRWNFKSISLLEVLNVAFIKQVTTFRGCERLLIKSASLYLRLLKGIIPF